MRTLKFALFRLLGFNPQGWLLNTWRMAAWVQALESSKPSAAQAATRIAVVITPWLGTSVPWYTLATGVLLAAKGNRLTFILDDYPFGDSPVRYRFVLHCLQFVLGRLDARHRVVVLSRQRAEAPPAQNGVSLIKRLARLNAVWALRGEMLVAGRQRYTDRCIEQLSAANKPIAGFLQMETFDLLFIPGGVYGTSGLWAEHACAAGIRVASFDSGGYGTAMIACNGIACQLQDIPEAVRLLKARCAADPVEGRFAADSADAEMAKRRAGVDAFASQVQGGGSGDLRYDGAVLIALNSSWDAAALGLHSVYADNTEWIVESTRYLLSHTTASVIVRQHPAERLPIAHTTDDYRSLLRKHFGDHPRLHFIAADQSINSYELLERVAAVVVYTSTIGTEAAALGKPVITPSRSYYSRLGFVWQATELHEYQALLSAAAKSELVVTSTMREDAKLCFYLTQVCNWVFTPFNPADFKDWIRIDPPQLAGDAKTQSVLKSLQENVPVAFLNHLERWGEINAKKIQPI